jgi:hypothetical protein
MGNQSEEGHYVSISIERTPKTPCPLAKGKREAKTEAGEMCQLPRATAREE